MFPGDHPGWQEGLRALIAGLVHFEPMAWIAFGCLVAVVSLAGGLVALVGCLTEETERA